METLFSGNLSKPNYSFGPNIDYGPKGDQLREVTLYICTYIQIHILFLVSCVQEFFRKGYMECPSSVSIQELREACDYFIIPFNETGQNN